VSKVKIENRNDGVGIDAVSAVRTANNLDTDKNVLSRFLPFVIPVLLILLLLGVAVSSFLVII
jgi:hypothetical protein